MSIAHINPGYDNYENNVARARNQPHLLDATHHTEDSSAQFAESELAHLKAWARQTWSRPDRNETTYQFHHGEKNLLERTKSAPSESERRNNPHPKQMFMTTRLHYVPGYHNADTTVNRGRYVVDKSCSPEEQVYRQGIKEKYVGGISTAAVRQYAPTDQEDTVTWKRALPPNDNWMASSTYRDRQGIGRSFDGALMEANSGSTSLDGPLASHYRYLRMAGGDEQEKIRRALDAKGDPDKVPNMMIPYQQKGTKGSQKQQDIANIQRHPNKPLYRYPLPRGDYLIHPVWPPSMWHHRIPGFKATPPTTLSPYEIHQRKALSGIY